MEFEIHVSEEDYLQYNRYHARHSPVTRGQLKLFWLLYAAMAALLILLGCLEDPLLGLIYAALLGASALALRFLLPRIMDRNVKRSLLRLRKEGKLPYESDARVELGEEAVVSRSEHGEYRVPYSEVEGIREDENAIYVYYGAVQAVLLPRRCLRGEDGAVLAYLRERCPGAGGKV